MINQNSIFVGDREETHLATWLLTAADGEGQPIENPLNADRTVTVVGDVGAFNTQTLQIQGSNDATSWFVLTTPTGTALSLTAAAIAAIAENPRYIRPMKTSGGAFGAAGIKVQILSRRGR